MEHMNHLTLKDMVILDMGVDNFTESYTEYCMFGGYTDYEPEQM